METPAVVVEASSSFPMGPSTLTPSLYVLSYTGRSSPQLQAAVVLLLLFFLWTVMIQWVWDWRRIKMGSLRLKMGVVPLHALLLLLVGCADAARDISVPIANDAGRNRPVLDDPLKLHELVKLSQNEVPSLDGLPTEFCHSCLEISRKANKILSDPSLFNEVDYLASSFCHILPSDLEIKCMKMVEMHKRESVLFLQDAFIEEKFCYNSGFCPDKAEKSSSLSNIKTELLTAIGPFINLLNKLQKGLMVEAPSGFMTGAKTFTLKNEIPVELRSNATCIACRNVLNKILNELEDPDKQLKIITSLLKACEIEVFVYRCKKLVFAYGPLVISNLQKIVSMDLCHMVHICEDPRNQSSHMNMMNARNSGLHLQSALAKLAVI